MQVQHNCKQYLQLVGRLVKHLRGQEGICATAISSIYLKALSTKCLSTQLDRTLVEGEHMNKILVTGAGGFIGGHLVKRLKREGYWIRAVDLKYHEFSAPPADEFMLGDLRDQNVARRVVEGIDEVYQLAADMGGAG